MLTPLNDRVVGCFDTVSALDVRSALYGINKEVDPFGLPNVALGPGIKRALHALAIDEQRTEFPPMLWTQGREGRQKGQNLMQVMMFP